MNLDFTDRQLPQLTSSEGVSSFDLKNLWHQVRGRWPWVAAAVVLGILLGVGKYLASPKLYRASTQIQIEPRNLAPVGKDRNPWIEQWTNMKYFPTQYRLLRSRGLAERVIDELRLDTDPTFAPPPPSGNEPITPEEDERYKAALANRLIGGLSINPIQGTELLDLVYVSTDPQRAADLANGFASAFIQWGVDSRSETLREASRLIETQITNVQNDVAALERRIQDFNRRSEATTTDAGAGAATQRLQNLNDQYSSAAATALSKQQRYNELANMSDELVAASAGTAAIATLRSEWESKRNEYNEGLKTFKPDHPEMTRLNDEVDRSRRRYDQEIVTQANTLRSAAQSEWRAAQQIAQRVDAQRRDAQRESLDLNVDALPRTNMQLELTAKRQRLSELVESQSQASLSQDVQADVRSNVHVIDKALVPSGPFRPSLRQNVAVGGGVGLLLGLGLVFLVHYLDRTIKSVEELEALLGLPVLAAIPELGSGQSYGYRVRYGREKRVQPSEPEGAVEIELLPDIKPKLAVSEAYRSLRTSLLLSSADELKVVTVTSAEAGEGKSATSSNLATVLAQLGKKVLIIDGDLRKARQHRIFDAPNSKGLVDSLARGTHPEDLVQKTRIPGLFLMPAGAHPPNPSELLASERMQHLAAWARKQFDFVIIDSPPILAVSDAILPGAISDGVVLCFRANAIERDTAKRCTEQLRLSGVKILGLVLNRYRPGASRYYDRRYETYEAYADSAA